MAPNLAIYAGIAVFFLAQVAIFLYFANARRLWGALVRLGLFVGLIVLPWVVVWVYPPVLDLLMTRRFLNLNRVLMIAVPAVGSLLLFWLALRLDLKPRWIPDPKDDTNPILAVLVLPVTAAVVSGLTVLLVDQAASWLFAEFGYYYLPLVGRLITPVP